jgi:Pentapeptide repeats (9 copies)
LNFSLACSFIKEPVSAGKGEFTLLSRRCKPCFSQQGHEDFDFSGVWFPEHVNFADVDFSADANFSGATFSAGADFKDATFSADANFRGATFRRRADFGQATFSAITYFENTTFSADADFQEPHLKIMLTLQGNKIQGHSGIKQSSTFNSRILRNQTVFRSTLSI